MSNPLRLLLVEDEEDDALLMTRLLEKEGFEIDVHRIQLPSEMESALENKDWDLIICDFRLPKFSGRDALNIYKKKAIDIPFILLSGTVGEEIAVDMMKAGAHDYIMKDHLLQLGPSIRRALGDAEVRKQNKQALEDLRLSKEKAEKSDRVRSTLLSNMSHEFRTPLTSILGYAEVIMEDGMDPEIRKSALKIFNSGKRLMKTLDSITLLSQMESGINPILREFDLHSLLNKSLESHKEFSNYKSLNLEKRLDGKFMVVSDEELVLTACSALLDNAIKFTTRGTIQITTTAPEIDGVRMAGFSITDEGIGISPENLEMIFEAFHQVSEGYSRHYEGIGLGLSITKRITLILGGKIKVESIEGKGSSFTFLFPLAGELTGFAPKVEIGKRPDRPKAKEPAPEKPTVLVVEDHETNAELACLYLAGQFSPEVAYRGEDALQMAGKKKYDIILMDINLGSGINGIETLHEIRKLSLCHDTPVVAMTGYTQIGDRQRLISEGFNQYLAKPFDKSTLTGCLQSILC
ncbi:MAG: response regulator [bacterium]